MFHPGTDVNQLVEELSVDQIQEKLTNLYNQIRYYHNIGNLQAIHQLDMLLETYQEAYNRKIESLIPDKNMFNNKIRIGK